MVDSNPESIICLMKHMWLKLECIPVLNVHVITDSLGLHSSKEE